MNGAPTSAIGPTRVRSADGSRVTLGTSWTGVLSAQRVFGAAAAGLAIVAVAATATATARMPRASVFIVPRG